MPVTTLKAPPGISPSKIIDVPDEWSKRWFLAFVKNYLQPADIRNAIAGTGIKITGSGNQYATVSTTGGGSGTVTSVGLADGSSTPIFAITGSPVTVSGTLTATLKTQSANAVFAGPTTGAAAQPTFRALVVADIPSGYAYSNLSGAPSIPVGANPTASVGLAAVNGSAATFMRSDGAPQLSQAITPTWTGAHIFQPSSGTPAAFIAPSSDAGATGAGRAWVAQGSPNHFTAEIQGSATSGQSYGLVIQAGTTSADRALDVINQANSLVLWRVFGDGGAIMGNPTGGDKGASTINVAGGYYINGVPLGPGSGSGAKVTIFDQSGGASQTWTASGGSKFCRVICIGGGGGGGSGAENAAAGAAGGGGGGGGGSVSIMDFVVSTLGGTASITFGNAATGGNGGAGVASGTGNAGTAGSTAQFGTGPLIMATGGNPGNAGTTSAGGTQGTGASSVLTYPGTGGAPGGLGSNGGNGSATGGVNAYGPSGGGGGGAVTVGNAGTNGGTGGALATSGTVAGGTAGSGSTAPGGTGGQGPSLTGYIGLGGGGGGGGNGSTAAGGTGGQGGTYGGGGGGGGASHAATSGAGGRGGFAAVIVIEW